MRIQPVVNGCINNKKFNSNQTKFESNEVMSTHRNRHQYTGIASVDLAYASMYDSAIARDLKLMGLI